MSKEIVLLFLLICTFICTVRGQDERTQLIKEAVRFRTKIDTRSHDLKNLDTCKDIKCIAAFAKSTKIARLDVLVGNWQQSSEFQQNDPDLLSKRILDDLTAGGKANRKTDFKEEYNAFTDAIGLIVTPLPPSKPVARLPLINKQNSQQKKLASKETALSLNELLGYASLALSTIAFVVLLLLYRKLTRLAAKLQYVKHEGEKKVSRQEYEGQMEKLINEVLEMQAKLPAFPASLPTTSTQISAILPVNEAEEITEPIGEAEIKYAKSSVNGRFSAADLKNKQTGECIFELHISNKNAVLKLSKDKKTQQYALNMNPEYYFTKEICDIRGLPASNKNITMNQEGILAYDNASDDWLVTRKILLTFD